MSHSCNVTKLNDYLVSAQLAVMETCHSCVFVILGAHFLLFLHFYRKTHTHSQGLKLLLVILCDHMLHTTLHYSHEHTQTHTQLTRNSDSLLSHRERNWEISQVGSYIPNRSFGGYQWNVEEATNTHTDTNQNTKIASIIARFTKGLLELGSYFSVVSCLVFFLGNKKKPQPISDVIRIMSFAKENSRNVLPFFKCRIILHNWL